MYDIPSLATAPHEARCSHFQWKAEETQPGFLSRSHAVSAPVHSWLVTIPGSPEQSPAEKLPIWKTVKCLTFQERGCTQPIIKALVFDARNLDGPRESSLFPLAPARGGAATPEHAREGLPSGLHFQELASLD